ncbi:MAG TPA: T9SS type A sorting domain-containing protein [Chitinophagales bacterium]|nr:T9SS type A sorting domain-containing protein [Chitinophagales bacterium]
MKKIILIWLLAGILTISLSAQNDCVPGKLHGDNEQFEVFTSIVLLENGDYITGGVGLNLDLGYRPMFFARINACGDSVWVKLWGEGDISFQSADIYYSPGDNFIVSAMLYYSFATTEYSYGLVKISLNGDIIWLRNYVAGLKNSGAADVIQTADGGFAIVGFSQNFPNDYARIWFIKTDSEGNVEWDRFYGTESNSEVGEHLLQLPDGGYLILGRRTTVSSGLVRIWLIRTDAQGNVLWERFYGNNFATYGSDLIPVSDGYMIGGIQYAAPTWQVDGDAYLLKTDTFGITQWVRTYGGYYGEQITNIMPLADGNFACIGSDVTVGNGSADAWLFKVSAAGDSLWSKSYRYYTAPIHSEYFWDFAPAPEGGFMICGSVSRPFPNNQDAWVVRTDSLGNPCPPYNGCDWAVGVSPPPPYPIKEENAVYVYPNPAQNTLHFTLQNTATPPMSGWQIALYNPTGHRVLHNTLSPASATASVEIGHLPVGIYFYTIEWGGVALARGKIVKSGK